MTITKGLCTDIDWGDQATGIMQAEVQDARELGARWIRITINWRDLEPQRGVWSSWWVAYVSQSVSAAHANGMSVLAVIGNGFPDWTDADHPQDFAAFAARCIALWPNIGAFEIWNEPNNSRFWPNPDPVKYAAHLQAASQAIKRVRPTALVIYGGLAAHQLGVADTWFLRASLNASAGAPGVFHALGIHPYAALPLGVRTVWRSYRNILGQAVAGTPPIWLTEVGWSTSARSRGEWMAPVDEATQAAHLAETYQLAAQDTQAGVTLIFWYAQRNNWWQHDDPTSIEAGFGLSRVNRSRKPAYQVFQSIR